MNKSKRYITKQQKKNEPISVLISPLLNRKTSKKKSLRRELETLDDNNSKRGISITTPYQP
jgi:hypothetical protein